MEAFHTKSLHDHRVPTFFLDDATEIHLCQIFQFDFFSNLNKKKYFDPNIVPARVTVVSKAY